MLQSILSFNPDSFIYKYSRVGSRRNLAVPEPTVVPYNPLMVDDDTFLRICHSVRRMITMYTELDKKPFEGSPPKVLTENHIKEFMKSFEIIGYVLDHVESIRNIGISNWRVVLKKTFCMFFYSSNIFQTWKPNISFR